MYDVNVHVALSRGQIWFKSIADRLIRNEEENREDFSQIMRDTVVL